MYGLYAMDRAFLPIEAYSKPGCASGAEPLAAAEGGLKKLPALHARNLAWLGWAHEVLGLPGGSALKWEAETLCDAAQGLAACRPYVMRLADVSVEVVPYPLKYCHAACPRPPPSSYMPAHAMQNCKPECPHSIGLRASRVAHSMSCERVGFSGMTS